MKTKSAKAKGRLLQQWVRDKILRHLPLHVKDVRSTVMGDSGTDIQLSEKAYRMFPYDVECKNVEKLNVWQAYAQAHTRDMGEPLVIIKRNRHKPLAVVDAEYFIRLHGALNEALDGHTTADYIGIGGVTD